MDYTPLFENKLGLNDKATITFDGWITDHGKANIASQIKALLPTTEALADSLSTHHLQQIDNLRKQVITYLTDKYFAKFDAVVTAENAFQHNVHVIELFAVSVPNLADLQQFYLESVTQHE